jgi:hypothetical protein
MNYKECKYCKAALDFGEKCNCQEEKELKMKELESLFCVDTDGQLTLIGGYQNEYSKN